MFRYTAFGLSIDSELELPNFPPGNAEPDVLIRLGAVMRRRGKATLNDQIAVNSHTGAFHIKGGREIIVEPLKDANPERLRLMLMGRVMAYLLQQRGCLPLHASGVSIDGRAILFLGMSGTGKSTTAAAFYARGHQVITDDVAAVRVCTSQCMVDPTGARIRLFDDSRSAFNGVEPRAIFQWDKHTFDLQQRSKPEPLPLSRIYLQEYGEELRSEVIEPVPAVEVLSCNSFVKRYRLDREALAAHLRDCSTVATTVPVIRLSRIRSLSALPDLVQLVERNDYPSRRVI